MIRSFSLFSLLFVSTAGFMPAYGDIPIIESRHFQIVHDSGSHLDKSWAQDADQVYEKVVSFLKPKTTSPEKIKIQFLDPDEFKKIYPPSSFELEAYTPSYFDQMPTIFFKGSQLTINSHVLAHELFHIFDHPNSQSTKPEGRWIQEGLAELLASQISGLRPSLAILDFFAQRSPKTLFENDFSKFGLADYGQSFLFMEYIQAKYLKEKIFSLFLGQTNVTPERVVMLINEYSGSNLTLIQLYRDFILSQIGSVHPGSLQKLTLAGFSFSLVDVTFQTKQKMPYQIGSDKEVEVYLLQVQEDLTATLFDLRKEVPVPNNSLKSAYLLFLNPTSHMLSYEMSTVISKDSSAPKNSSKL